jgi:hypothetical protein
MHRRKCSKRGHLIDMDDQEMGEEGTLTSYPSLSAIFSLNYTIIKKSERIRMLNRDGCRLWSRKPLHSPSFRNTVGNG